MLQSLSCQLKCLRKGIPLRLLKFFWTKDSVKRFLLRTNPSITSGILYRRSLNDPLIKVDNVITLLSFKKHWDETTLGEISCNWNRYSKQPNDVFYLECNDKLLVSERHNRVLCCDLEATNNLPAYPLFQTLKEEGEGEIRIEINHSPNDCNYSHSNIDCYLTTTDGKFTNIKVPFEGWKEHPLNKKLKGLKGKYRHHLIYHFQNHIQC